MICSIVFIRASEFCTLYEIYWQSLLTFSFLEIYILETIHFPSNLCPLFKQNISHVINRNCGTIIWGTNSLKGNNQILEGTKSRIINQFEVKTRKRFNQS